MRPINLCLLCLGFVSTGNALYSAAVGYLNRHQRSPLMDPNDPSFLGSRWQNQMKSHNPTPDEAHCKDDTFDSQCDLSSFYRNYDGSCNNLLHPTWGMSNNCHLRMLEASYEGKDDIRKSVKGGKLPPPRDLSINIAKNRKRPTPLVSFLFTVFGQMVAHDISLTPTQTPPESCCLLEAASNRSQCAAITIRPDDPFYSRFNVTCQSFERSKVCSSCDSEKRQQPNIVTAAVDASVLYGSTEDRARRIRTLDGTGRMKSTNTSHGELLPRPPKHGDTNLFCPGSLKPKCFYAGYDFVNQHTTLTAIQTLFLREHNRIVDFLARMNPEWDGETLFQQTRRIVGAIFQNIVYSEYLPALLGPEHMSYYKLFVQPGNRDASMEDASAAASTEHKNYASKEGETDVSSPDNQSILYDPDIRIGIWDEFSTTVFRLHSMVPTRVGFDHHIFRDYYSNPQILRKGKMDKILQGTSKVPSEKNDHWFVKEVTCHFQQHRNEDFGMDLVSVDIQRGRDHGMPPYVDMLWYLSDGKMNVSYFEDLRPLMPARNIEYLKDNYADVRDVDLFVGELMERHVKDSNLGPTACAIVGEQFHSLKYGDRFYFEHEKEVPSFTPAQRESLKKSSLSRIMCDNTDTLSMQNNAFLLESDENPLTDCDHIPKIDLTLWKTS